MKWRAFCGRRASLDVPRARGPRHRGRRESIGRVPAAAHPSRGRRSRVRSGGPRGCRCRLQKRIAGLAAASRACRTNYKNDRETARDDSWSRASPPRVRRSRWLPTSRSPARSPRITDRGPCWSGRSGAPIRAWGLLGSYPAAASDRRPSRTLRSIAMCGARPPQAARIRRRYGETARHQWGNADPYRYRRAMPPRESRKGRTASHCRVGSARRAWRRTAAIATAPAMRR